MLRSSILAHHRLSRVLWKIGPLDHVPDQGHLSKNLLPVKLCAAQTSRDKLSRKNSKSKRIPTNFQNPIYSTKCTSPGQPSSSPPPSWPAPMQPLWPMWLHPQSIPNSSSTTETIIAVKNKSAGSKACQWFGFPCEDDRIGWWD